MYESTDKMVSHPDHYQAENGMEVINVIEAFTADLKGIEATDTGNIIKYICRWKKKNGIQDLEKVIWYATHLIEHLKRKETECAAPEPKEQDIQHDYTVEELVKRYVELHKEEKTYSFIISSKYTYTAEYVPGKKNTIRLTCDRICDEYFRYNNSDDWTSWYGDE